MSTGGIKLIESLINFISILDSGNILERSQDMLAVQQSSYLFRGKGVLFEGQRTMDGSDPIVAPQYRIGEKWRYADSFPTSSTISAT